MISAYFDDSGTHDASKIVVMAGIVGTESEMMSLEGLWREHLERPLGGRKEKLSRFHAIDCDRSTGEFARWSRVETDYYKHELRAAIIRSHVAAYGFACVRKDWDDIIQGDVRDILGDPEGQAVRNCFVSALKWARENTFDPQIAFVFDDRPHRARENRAVFDAFQRWGHPPELVGISFLTSHKIIPLQAADLFAWEFNRHAHEVLSKGLRTPASQEMLHFAGNMQLRCQLAQRDKIAQIKEHVLSDRSDTELSRMVSIRDAPPCGRGVSA
jgi:hypothetical protein